MIELLLHTSLGLPILPLSKSEVCPENRNLAVLGEQGGRRGAARRAQEGVCR